MKVLIDVPLLTLFTLGYLIPEKDRRENRNGKPWPNCTFATITMTLQFVNVTQEQYCLQSDVPMSIIATTSLQNNDRMVGQYYPLVAGTDI